MYAFYKIAPKVLLSLVRDEPSDLEPQMTMQLSSLKPAKSKVGWAQ